MTTFIIGAAALALFSLVFLLPPFLGRTRVDDLDRDAQNVSIAKDRLGELKADFEAGAITEAEYETGKSELETSLATDLDDKPDPILGQGASSPVTALMIAVLTLSFTGAMYAYLGEPDGLDVVGPGKPVQRAATTASGKPIPSIDEMVAALAAKLEREPNNIEGWFMLGRSYGVMERWPDAVRAYRRAVALADDQPRILIHLAEAIAAISPDGLAGEPEELIQKALVLEPNNVQALWFSGLAFIDREEFAKAAEQWKRILPMLDDDPEGRKDLEATIAQAEAAARGESADSTPAPANTEEKVAEVEQVAAAAPEAKVTVTVTLSDAVKAEVASNDVVYIFARATQGPPMPLAAKRVTVGDLPITIELDDSMAMMPQMAISKFPEVQIQARVSLSGQPTAQAGDYQSISKVAKHGDAVGVEIDSKVQ